MAQFIDKSAVVAEIRRMIKNAELSFENQRLAMCELLSYLDTLEAKGVDLEKEVDLRKEIDNVWNPHFNLGWDDNSLVSINHKSFEFIAKHFFELGLKAQKGE